MVVMTVVDVVVPLARRRGCVSGKVVIVTAVDIVALPVAMPLPLSTFGDSLSTSVPSVCVSDSVVELIDPASLHCILSLCEMHSETVPDRCGMRAS